MRVALLGNSDGLCSITRGWCTGGNVDVFGDRLGNRCRAVLRDRNDGSSGRRLRLRCVGRRLRLGGSSRVNRDVAGRL